MTTPQRAAKLEVGDKAPTFNLPSFPSGSVSLDSFLGKSNVILAFYPKDNTPGCTKEMCAFSEDVSKFQSQDTVVFGISCDSVKAHEGFANKYNLKQGLLSDEGGKVGTLYGTVYDGKATASRVLFVIDKDGKIAHIHEGMPDNAQLLKVLDLLK